LAALADAVTVWHIQQLKASARTLASRTGQSDDPVKVVQDRAARVNALAAQLLGASGEVLGAVSGWNLAEVRRSSRKPTGDEESLLQGSA
jgi:hypothetical protein